jgi:hypothetical protein
MINEYGLLKAQHFHYIIEIFFREKLADWPGKPYTNA